MNRANERTVCSHPISGAFVFMLLGVFALFATLVVLLGAQFYRNAVEQTALNNQQLILTNYIANIVSGNDTADGVAVGDIDGISMLSFLWNAGDESYATHIYCHDGYLREYFGEAYQDFDPDFGEKICPAREFVPSINGGLITAKVVTASGEAVELNMALRCSQGVVE